MLCSLISAPIVAHALTSTPAKPSLPTPLLHPDLYFCTPNPYSCNTLHPDLCSHNPMHPISAPIIPCTPSLYPQSHAPHHGSHNPTHPISVPTIPCTPSLLCQILPAQMDNTNLDLDCSWVGCLACINSVFSWTRVTSAPEAHTATSVGRRAATQLNTSGPESPLR